MPQNVTVYRCLIICPGDVEEARSAIVETLNQWNAQIGRDLQVNVQPVHWGYATPELGGAPQSVINRQLVDDCDMGLAVFWSRLGTKTATHESGSVEEIRRLQSRGCWVGVYFNAAPIPQKRLADDQYPRLQEVRKVFEKEGLLCDYDSIDRLKMLVTLHVTNVLSRLALRDKGVEGPQIAKKSTLTIAREFRDERIKVLSSGPPTIVMHMFPLSIAEKSKNFVPFIKERRLSFFPFFATGHNMLSNAKGVMFKHSEGSYVQLYRSAALESLDTTVWSARIAWGGDAEATIMNRARDYLNNYSAGGVEPPIFAALSLLHVKGAKVYGRRDFLFRDDHVEIEEESLVLPEVVISDYAAAIEKQFQPMWDVVWQAAGYDTDPNYDATGKWTPLR